MSRIKGHDTGWRSVSSNGTLATATIQVAPMYLFWGLETWNNFSASNEKIKETYELRLALPSGTFQEEGKGDKKDFEVQTNQYYKNRNFKVVKTSLWGHF